MDQNKLGSLLSELERLTGIQMNICADTPEETALAVEQLHRICSAYREKYDKEYFLKSIAYASLPSFEIERQASLLHINPAEARIGFLLETGSSVSSTVITILKHLITRNGTFFIPIADKQILILMPVSEKKCTKDYLQTFLSNIIETLNMEAFEDGWIACGPVIHHLSELTDMFKRLSLTLSIGHIFHSEQRVLMYNHLGIGNLIYELPADVCKNFLNEVFLNKVPVLEPELISVTNCFFENNLNISETARQLHMHRNTLIGRLEQIEQMTNLNLRNFEDAIIFKIALMILKRSYFNE